MPESLANPLHDLTSRIGASLDPHHVLPLLEFAETNVGSSVVGEAKLSLLKHTNMVDYAVEIYQKIGGKGEPEWSGEKRKTVMATLDTLTKGAKAFADIVGDSSKKKELVQGNNWSVQGLDKSVGVKADAIENYRKLAKFQYECGDYETAYNMLENYLSLFVPQQKGSQGGDSAVDTADDYSGSANNNNMSANAKNMPAFGLTDITATLHGVLWGKLSCLILMGKWDEAMVALNAVKYSIDVRSGAEGGLSALQSLKERTWLLHWGLFVFWNNSKKGLDAIIDLYMQDKNIQAIQTNAPHLLRYLASAIIINKRKRANLKDLVKFINHCDYADPIIQFVDCLYVKFDFEGAQQKLQACESVLATDFFLHNQTKLFMEEARVFIFENYCRIHQKIDIATLAEKLSMQPEDAERWIVDLIRNASLDAKIDSTENCVIMGHTTHSVYQQVINKTKDLTARSGNLTNNFKSYLGDVREKERREREAAREME
ncbi:hypothetical protein TrRE_jg4283 [Triparma retinervis]|uniref:Eukaryotic translation initiation factor 3 subunit E n=1 Tax=Triparma retinervis TaxID=2557542 RepID=A0A9W6ZGG8_9STRA|nr:hypothetical protein TrRE_jg4283 [Triparma retinervis]